MKLATNLDDGVQDDPEKIEKRKESFGSNTYPKKKPKGILVKDAQFVGKQRYKNSRIA